MSFSKKQFGKFNLALNRSFSEVFQCHNDKCTCHEHFRIMKVIVKGLNCFASIWLCPWWNLMQLTNSSIRIQFVYMLLVWLMLMQLDNSVPNSSDTIKVNVK